MKKFKLLCTVVAMVLVVGMFATTAMAASFTTTTNYTATGDAAVSTVVTGITEAEVGSQITYVAYKNGVVTTGDNILYIDQRAVENTNNITFGYTVPKAEFDGVSVTTIGMGSSGVAPTAEATSKTIAGCNVEVLASENGVITLADADATVYPGNTALLNIAPADGYELTGIKVNGEDVAVTIGATSYALTVDGDVTVQGVFGEVAVNISPEVGDFAGAAVDSLTVDSVKEFFAGVADVDLSAIEGLANVEVKSVVGKLIGNPANFANYEFGLRVTYTDTTTEDFPALYWNEDNAFAVRLIDTTAEQNAFQNVFSVETYMIEK